jgi:hypothetical protein
MLLHLEFYSVPPDGSLKHCEKITFSTTSMDLAVGHAEKVLEDRTFPFGKANLCLIKDEDGGLIREVWHSKPPLPRNYHRRVA